MDYKTNILKSQLDATKELFPEIRGLKFAHSRSGQTLMDYTAYFENVGLPPTDYKAFMRANRRYIEAIAGKSGTPTSELFYINKDGHVLIAAELTFLALAYANPELCYYFNSIVEEAMSSGLAISIGTVYRLAEDRLPVEELETILDRRKKQNEEGSEQ